MHQTDLSGSPVVDVEKQTLTAGVYADDDQK